MNKSVKIKQQSLKDVLKKYMNKSVKINCMRTENLMT
jgi:hypothetical protein